MNRSAKAYSQERFIQMLKDKYSDRYSFDKVIYKGALTKITVTCFVHGDFETYASAFLNSEEFSGCLACREEVREKQKEQRIRSRCIKNVSLNDRDKSVERIMNLCSRNHNNRYIYDSEGISPGDEFLNVICPAHGPFTVPVLSHKRGKAPCPVCHENRKKHGKFLADTEFERLKHRYGS